MSDTFHQDQLKKVVCSKCGDAIKKSLHLANIDEWHESCGDKDLWDRFSHVYEIVGEKLIGPLRILAIYRDGKNSKGVNDITLNTVNFSTWGTASELISKYRFVSRKTGKIINVARL